MSAERTELFPETRPAVQGPVDAPVMTIDEAAGAPAVGENLEPGGERSGYLGLSLGRKRLLAFFFVLFSLLAAVAARAGYLGIVEGERYRAMADGNRLRVLPIPAERGIIYDRNGRLLARNIPDFTLTITPADLPRNERERRELIVRLAEMTEGTPIDIEQALRRYPRELTSPVPVKSHLPYEKAVLLDVQSGIMPGVSVSLGTKREYLLTDPDRGAPILSLSHLLGYLGPVNEDEFSRLRSSGYLLTDSIGKTGIEASYESRLRGTYGKKKIEVDAFGREQNVLAQEEPVQGRDLTLSIDAGLQAETERLVRTAAGLNGPGRGAAVAMDPRTGEILALVSWPAYDANLFSGRISARDYAALVNDPNRPLFPRAVSGTYPPGSTIKLVVAAAALAEGVITPSTSFLSTGGIRIGQWFFPDWRMGGHGATNVVKAIAESVNTFFYAAGGGWDGFKGLGVERLGLHLRRFGLGKPLGVDLPNEASGFVPSIEWKEDAKGEPWYIGDTYHLSIGQGDVLVTPLQVAAWTAVFANGGDLVRPTVVKRDGPAFLAERIVSPEVVATVRRGMRETIAGARGSARSLQLSPWPIAGKTGTAQWREGQPNHAWFTGFAPYEAPEIVVTVLIEAGGEGSSTAAPVARGIIDAWLGREREAGR